MSRARFQAYPIPNVRAKCAPRKKDGINRQGCLVPGCRYYNFPIESIEQHVKLAHKISMKQYNKKYEMTKQGQDGTQTRPKGGKGKCSTAKTVAKSTNRYGKEKKDRFEAKANLGSAETFKTNHKNTATSSQEELNDKRSERVTRRRNSAQHADQMPVTRQSVERGHLVNIAVTGTKRKTLATENTRNTVKNKRRRFGAQKGDECGTAKEHPNTRAKVDGKSNNLAKERTRKSKNGSKKGSTEVKVQIEDTKEQVVEEVRQVKGYRHDFIPESQVDSNGSTTVAIIKTERLQDETGDGEQAVTCPCDSTSDFHAENLSTDWNNLGNEWNCEASLDYSLQKEELNLAEVRADFSAGLKLFVYETLGLKP